MSLVVNAQIRRTQIDVIPEVIVQFTTTGSESIRVVRPAQFDSATVQTPGSQRFAAV
jgi:hypothetical protein